MSDFDENSFSTALLNSYKLNIFQKIRLLMARKNVDLKKIASGKYPYYILDDKEFIDALMSKYSIDEIIRANLPEIFMSSVYDRLSSKQLARAYIKTKSETVLDRISNEEFVKLVNSNQVSTEVVLQEYKKRNSIDILKALSEEQRQDEKFPDEVKVDIFKYTRDFKVLRTLPEETLLELVEQKAIKGKELACFSGKNEQFKRRLLLIEPESSLRNVTLDIDKIYEDNSEKGDASASIIDSVLKSARLDAELFQKNPRLLYYTSEKLPLVTLTKLYEQSIITNKDLINLGYVSKDVQELFSQHGIDLSSRDENVDWHIYSQDEINSIVAEDPIYKPTVTKRIAIEDIVGFNAEEHGVSDNFLLAMSHFFDSGSNRDAYQKRALGMLGYTSLKSAMNGLESSFEQEPMRVKETGEKGKYILGNNGYHRYMLLKFLQLSNAEQGISENAFFPVQVTRS